MTKKFVVFGSCLSGQIARRLVDKGYIYLAGLRHVRSDLFTNHFDKGEGFSLNDEDIEFLMQSSGNKISQDAAKRLRSRLSMQTKLFLDEFVSNIRKADFVIFDNQYDLERRVSEVCIKGESHLVSNIPLGSFNVRFKHRPLIPRRSLGNYNDIFYLLKDINPKIKFLFFQYPIVKNENLKETGRYDRVSRSKITEKNRNDWEFYSTPLFEIDKRLVSEKNVNHFKSEAYDIFSHICEKLIEENKIVIPSRLIGIFEKSDIKEDDLGKVRAESPYKNLPDRQYWKPAVAEPYPLAITDLYRKKFDIGVDYAVATCGSCFAQHIGKRLDRQGYNYMDVEPIPEGLSADKAKALGYGIYSARYGNVYTSRQLIQLFERAYGELDFDEVWKDKKGRYVDPFRPNLCGEGYTTAEEVLHEQRLHLSNVRRMFETLDVFVFTMGVTETWINRQSGAVYPICPGVTAGSFDPDQHEFVNLDYATILEEMESFLSRLRSVNPNAKVLLTVSPVPLTATAEERHVLLSTMASKSILRAVADQLYRRHAHVDYFPSYDIIMSPPYKSMFFKNNLRSIHEEGVDYVMSHFFAQHRLENEADSKPADSSTFHKASPQPESEEDDEAFCDEAFLELERKTAGNNHE